MENVHDALAAKFKEMGLVHFHASWNEDWVAKVRAMPEGPEKEAEIDKGLSSILESMEAIERGECTVLEGDALKEKLDGPWAVEAAGPPAEVQKIIDGVSIESV